MKQNSKKIRIIVCAVLLIVFSIVVCISSYLNDIRQINILTPELSSLANGDYKGGYTILPVDVEVKVSIENNQISNVEILKHFNGLGKQAEAVIPLVLNQQNLDVDIVSGATVSSKCILKAIENAMTKGLNNE